MLSVTQKIFGWSAKTGNVLTVLRKNSMRFPSHQRQEIPIHKKYLFCHKNILYEFLVLWLFTEVLAVGYSWTQVGNSPHYWKKSLLFQPSEEILPLTTSRGYWTLGFWRVAKLYLEERWSAFVRQCWDLGLCHSRVPHLADWYLNIQWWNFPNIYTTSQNSSCVTKEVNSGKGTLDATRCWELGTSW